MISIYNIILPSSSSSFKHFYMMYKQPAWALRRIDFELTEIGFLNQDIISFSCRRFSLPFPLFFFGLAVLTLSLFVAIFYHILMFHTTKPSMPNCPYNGENHNKIHTVVVEVNENNRQALLGRIFYTM